MAKGQKQTKGYQMLETLKVTGAIALVIATAVAVLSLLAWAYGF
jgi:hypothetical protein